MALTVISLGFGSRSSDAGVVTMGFGLTGAAPPVVVTNPSGGYFEPKRKRRTKDDIQADRIRFGVLKEPQAVEAVEVVAKTVIQQEKSALALKEREQSDLLERMLTERGIILEIYPKIHAVLLEAIREEVERQRQFKLKRQQAILSLLMDF